MVEALLDEHGIRCLVRRPPGADVAAFLSGGPREILVHERDAARARELVEAHFGLR
jgi:hypothetical protein